MIKRWGVIGLAVMIIAGIGLGYAYLREPEQASGPITALPIQPAFTGDVDLNTNLAAAPADGTILFSIDPTQSEVRFMIDEILRGELNTVIGITNQVAGEIAIDFNDLSNSIVGPIKINMRTLTTDNNIRNRALQNRILNTNQFEFVVFTPTQIQNLPASVEIGEPFTIQLLGDLAIRNITGQETFEVTITAMSNTRIHGFGKVRVLRSDYDLAIPSVPLVGDVADEVFLEIEFIATS